MYLDSYNSYRYKNVNLFDYFCSGNLQFKIKDELYKFCAI